MRRGQSLPSTETCNACQQRIPLATGASCGWVTCPRGLHVGAVALANPNDIPPSNSPRMSGLEFEAFVRDRLIEKGYTTIETTRASGDFGADLIVRQDQKPRVIVIQCKRSASAVGVQAVQEVLGAKKYYKANEAWVVTNATFTPAARTLARSADVRLKQLVWTTIRKRV